MTLTPADVKLLRALQEGNTDSRNKLAEKVGMSPTTLWRRMTDMKEAGLIDRQVTLLNPEKLGLSVCTFVFVNLKTYSTETRSAFEAFVDQTAEIMECFVVTGTHDYTLIVRSRTVLEFERFLMEEVLNHPAVESASSQIALRQLKYSTAFPLE